MVQSKLSQSHVKYNNSPCKTKWKIIIFRNRISTIFVKGGIQIELLPNLLYYRFSSHKL